MSGKKTTDNTNFALVSPDGTRAGADALLGALPPGDGTEPLADLEGRLWVRVVGGIAPPGFPTKVQASAAALTNSEQVQLGACKLSTLSGFNNSGATTYYAQIYDLGAAPGGGDVPVQSIPVVAMAEFSWSPDLWEFVNGIWFALSTTPLTYTAAAVQAFWNAELYTP
jgi:hypothetical protein